MTFLVDAQLPARLVVTTGNISNAILLGLFDDHLNTIIAAFAHADFVELQGSVLIVHGRDGD